MSRTLSLVAAGAFALAAASVVRAELPPARKAVAVAPAPRVASRVMGPVTTHGDLAMRNLESDLAAATKRIEADPRSLDARLELGSLVYLRARVLGDIDEMARAVAITEATTRMHPAAADAWLALAAQSQSLHRFDSARASLERAAFLGADTARIVAIERELDWAAGWWSLVAPDIRAEAAARPSMSSLGRLGRLEHDLGRFDAAEALYARALEMVEDTGPIPVAMLEVQRGMNLADAGRLVDAERVFRSAAERLPAYVAAQEHLAETLRRLGRDEEAIRLYTRIVSVSRDPEFAGALASLHRAHGRTAEADALRARARQGYEELLAKYPEAMAWHAAEFFAGEGGDPARARKLLEDNVALRPNPESLDALARAERARGDGARADALSLRAAAIRAAATRTGG